MRRWIVICTLFLIFGYAKSQNTDSIFFPVIQTIRTGIIDYEFYNSHIHYNSIPSNLMMPFNTWNLLNNEKIEAVLYNTNDTLSIFNTTTKLQTKVFVEGGIYLSHVYFYNYDSIFVFFDRDFVYQMNIKKKKMPDFAIIDTLGHLKGKFSFDSVPNIDNVLNEPTIMLSGFNLKGNLVANNILYLPFSIYYPDITSPDYENLTLKLLCAYNLKEKTLKMLDIQIPKNYIGKHFTDNIINNGFDFKLLNDSTIIYSFNFSSDIFLYHINTDSSELVGTYPDFYFNNIVNPESKVFRTLFYAPEYLQKKQIYLRMIYVKEFNDQEICFTQILDKNFKILGYSLDDSLWSQLFVNAKGELISINYEENHIGEVLKIGSTKTLSLTEIINSLGNKIKHKKYVPQISLPDDLTLEEKMEIYLTMLNVPDNSKVIVLTGDKVCGNVLNFLLEQYKNHKSDFEEKKIVFLFYNTTKSTLEIFLNPYSIDIKDVLVDEQGLYDQIFGKSTNGQIYMVNKKKDRLKIKKTELKTLVKDFKHLTKIKI
ncbi:MAG: hypothetical protein H6Q25_235 [Bacteroidetes bacterium]|nr:hypothetical protein [Bacteroidota bacterium]